MFKKFFLCGSIGCTLEIFWTGLTALSQHDFRLKGHSSILMFPIYGLALVIAPAYKILKKYNMFIRGSLYTCGIFAVEFLSGSILKMLHMCPWNYSKAPFNINGVIRLDYAPVWFLTGLFYEKLLRSKS